MDRLTSFLHYKEQKLYLKFGLKKIYGSNPPNSDAIVSFKKMRYRVSIKRILLLNLYSGAVS